MKTVWKYDIPLTRDFALDLPKGAKPLLVAVQNEKPKVWFLIDTEAKTERKNFIVVGTGQEIAEEYVDHIGSFMLLGGDYVFHMFGECV